MYFLLLEGKWTKFKISVMTRQKDGEQGTCFLVIYILFPIIRAQLDVLDV